MPKANHQIIIDAIVKEIEQGADRGTVITKYCKKLQKSARTIDSYWKIANEQQQERQQRASKAADDAYIKAKEKAAVEAVMSAQERKEYLTKITKGEIEVPFTEFRWDVVQEKFVTVRGVKFAPHAARITAIAELNKMEGDYSPTKLEVKGEMKAINTTLNLM